MERRQYSDNDKASALAALDANAGNVNRTAKQLGIPRATLQEWIGGRVNADVPILRQGKKEDLASVFEKIAYQYLERAADDTAVKATAGKDAIIAAATATDKMRLLRGLPTEIVAILPDVITAITKLGKDPVTIFNDIIRRANEGTTDRPVD